MKSLSKSVFLLGVLAAAGCRGAPSARVMGEGEENQVDVVGAGAETFDRLVEGAVGKILQRHSSNLVPDPPLPVAFLGVENKSGEEIGEWREQLFELIDGGINRFAGYRTISDRFVQAALQKARLVPEELFLPEGRRQFAAALEAQQSPVSYLMFAKLTRGTTRGGSVTQRDYLLTLELVDVTTGAHDKESQEVRKAFRQR